MRAEGPRKRTTGPAVSRAWSRKTEAGPFGPSKPRRERSPDTSRAREGAPSRSGDDHLRPGDGCSGPWDDPFGPSLFVRGASPSRRPRPCSKKPFEVLDEKLGRSSHWIRHSGGRVRGTVDEHGPSRRSRPSIASRTSRRDVDQLPCAATVEYLSSCTGAYPTDARGTRRTQPLRTWTPSANGGRPRSSPKLDEEDLPALPRGTRRRSTSSRSMPGTEELTQLDPARRFRGRAGRAPGRFRVRGLPR